MMQNIYDLFFAYEKRLRILFNLRKWKKDATLLGAGNTRRVSETQYTYALISETYAFNKIASY